MAPRLDASVFDVFGELGKYEFAAVRGRGEGFGFADGLAVVLRFGRYRIDTVAAQFLPDIIMGFGQMAFYPIDIFFGKIKSGC